MTHADFLFELGTEELPPKSLTKLLDAFENSLCQQLQQANLEFGTVHTYATPRRLAVTIDQLQLKQASRQAVRRGPAVSSPEKATQGFARSCGVDLSSLEVIKTDKGSYYQFQYQISGSKTADLLERIIEQALADLPIAKRMRWGSSRAEFVRPVHWFILMLGTNLVECSFFGIKNNKLTLGHRSHSNQAFAIDSPATYAQQLREQGHVIVDFEERKEIIRQQVAGLVAEKRAQHIKAIAVVDEALLNEVCALVEWPVSLCGKFDPAFLELPAQVLISSMSEHQKYFHFKDSTSGNILPYFITVSNIDSKDPKAIIEGNERVIRPRLADAAFFFETDKKRALQSHLPALEKIVFQKQLGSLADKTRRITALAGMIAKRIGADADKAIRAGTLAKADLNTDMVLEFGDLQGLMGHVYALNDGEDPITAAAIEQHYWPKFAGDKLPTSLEASALALADRLDTLVGLFSIDQSPTGSKDPYALRRATVGLLRIFIEQALDLDLNSLIDKAYTLHTRDLNVKPPITQDDTKAQLQGFIVDRLRAYYEDQGISTEVYLAVLAKHPNSPLDFDHRVKAVSYFQTLPNSSSLSEANKRVSNILEKNGKGSGSVNTNLFVDKAEKGLYAALVDMVKATSVETDDYQSILTGLSSLAEPLDAFFKSTMVMVDDAVIRNNRLALLASIHSELGRVADISLLVAKK